jgi:lysophospholipase L1-like esterase
MMKKTTPAPNYLITPFLNRSMKILPIIFCLIVSFTYIAHAQDWPDLHRYKKANAKLSPPAPDENRVIFMGNSITDNWDNLDPAFFKKNPYINRGISGQTTPQMLIRFRADVIQLHPSVVVILAGTNDIAGNTGPSTLGMIENNLASMAQLAEINHIKVILCSVTPAAKFPWSPKKHPAEKIVKLNKWIKQYADKNGFVYCNYYSALVNKKGGMKAKLTTDGFVHPNKAGYNIMEPIVVQAIHKALSGDE